MDVNDITARAAQYVSTATGECRTVQARDVLVLARVHREHEELIAKLLAMRGAVMKVDDLLAIVGLDH